MKTRYRLIETVAGFAGIVAGERGLLRSYLPQLSAAKLRSAICRDFAGVCEDEKLLPGLCRALERYFAGERVAFDVRLDWNGRSNFEIDVLRACAAIPYGKTASYGALAARLGRPGAARSVGTMMSRNPFAPIVPCHRVVRSDGSIGGYSGPGGVSFKQRLLELEDATLLTSVSERC